MDFSTAKKLKEIEYNTVMDNPEAYGFPTFDEFKRNREKYMGRDDDALASADKGGEIINQFTQRHIYEIEGYRTKKIEEVERIAREQGIPLRELDYRPVIMPLGAGKCEILVKFVPKGTIAKRAKYA